MGWTVILSTSTNAESPVNDTLMDALRENADYNHDHAVRGGTHTSGVRLAIARGSKDFTVSSWTQIGATGVYHGHTQIVITYSTDADDSDPNFSAIPIITWGLDDNSDADWGNYNITTGFCTSTISDTAATVEVSLFANTNNSITGTLRWMAVAAVSSGE